MPLIDLNAKKLLDASISDSKWPFWSEFNAVFFSVYNILLNEYYMPDV